MDLTIFPTKTLQGDITLPGDKSISHRALILSAIAEGTSTLEGFLFSDDCLATLQILRACGVEITVDASRVHIKGVGLHGLQAPKHPLDCGNSGTTMRLLAGLFSGQHFASQLMGDNSLTKRPMQRIIQPLQQMGANITGNINDQFPPLSINKISTHLHGITYALPIPSAQVKSCLLIAGLYAQGETHIIERQQSRDHTERLLMQMGADIVVKNDDKNKNVHLITLKPGKPLTGQTITIPGDISSAAFFMVGASLLPGSHIILRRVGVNPLRTGIISILQAMGADIRLQTLPMMGNEPVADIEIRGHTLHGIEVPLDYVVSAIDEFPAIFMAAACAEGVTTIRGIQELRFKETDRIAQMVQNLTALGVQITMLPDGDGVRIEGRSHLLSATVDSGGDHRIAMACAIGAARAQGSIIIQNAASIATSFPNFGFLATMLGMSFEQEFS